MIEIKKYVLIGLSLLIFALIVWYKLPTEVQKSYTAASVDGKTINLEINLKTYRSLLAPDRIQGILILDGVPYIGDHPSRHDNFIERIKLKMNDVKYYPTFFQEGIYGMEKQDNMIYSMGARNKYNEIYIVQADMSRSSGTMVYYAPAGTSAEADRVARSFVK